MLELDRRSALVLSAQFLAAGLAPVIWRDASAPKWGRIPELDDGLDDVSSEDGAPGLSYGVAIVDAKTRRTYARNVRTPFTMASTVKLDIMLGLLARAEAQDRPLTSGERALALAMICRSNNAAASRLWQLNGGGSGMAELWDRLAVPGVRPGPGSQWGLSTSTVEGRIVLLRRMVNGSKAVPLARTKYLLSLMRQVTLAQRWGVPAIARYGELVEFKNGWVPARADDHRWTINSVGRSHGRVRGKRTDVRIAVVSRGHRTQADGIRFVEKVLVNARGSLGV